MHNKLLRESYKFGCGLNSLRSIRQLREIIYTLAESTCIETTPIETTVKPFFHILCQTSAWTFILLSIHSLMKFCSIIRELKISEDSRGNDNYNLTYTATLIIRFVFLMFRPFFRLFHLVSGGGVWNKVGWLCNLSPRGKPFILK